jgi:hypothetical protein
MPCGVKPEPFKANPLTAYGFPTGTLEATLRKQLAPSVDEAEGTAELAGKRTKHKRFDFDH